MILTRLSAFRTALWTLLAVNGTLLLIATLIGNRVDPGFNFPKVFAAYLVSFAFLAGDSLGAVAIKTSTQLDYRS